MKTIAVILPVLLVCAGCGKEATNARRTQTEQAVERPCDARIAAIEREMTNMPKQLEGTPGRAMFWSIDQAKAIMALDDRDAKIRLANQFLDSLSELKTALNLKHWGLAFDCYNCMMDACSIFDGEPELQERFLGIICDCIRVQGQEIRKWADAINNEPNRRARIPLKNLHGCLATYYMVFTNLVERYYFPRLKTHGLPADRHDYWRRQIDAAYDGKEASGK